MNESTGEDGPFKRFVEVLDTATRQCVELIQKLDDVSRYRVVHEDLFVDVHKYDQEILRDAIEKACGARIIRVLNAQYSAALLAANLPRWLALQHLRFHGVDSASSTGSHDAVQRFAELLAGDVVHAEVVSPLIGLEVTPKGGVSLFDGSIVLRPVTAADSAWLDQIPRWGSLVGHVAAVTFDTPIVKNPSSETPWQSSNVALERVLRVVWALRMLGKEFSAPIAVQWTPGFWNPNLVFALGEENLIGVSELVDKEHAQLNELVSALVRDDLDGSLRVAASRLNKAISTYHIDSRIVDAAIGLEALLLYDENTELSFKFALRYARLTATSASDAKDRYERARRVYKARSKIVHGSARKMGEAESLVAQEAIAMLREILLLFLERPAKPRFREDGFWDTVCLSDSPQA